MTTSNPAAKLEIAQRVSYISNASNTKDGEYTDAKTPDMIEGGAMRAGGAPNLLSKDYIGVLAQYASVGLVDAILPATIYPFLQNYLNATGATSVTASTLVTLPWSFKVFYGILSDCVPIFGYRRRPYMVIGWSIAILMLIIMGFMPVSHSYWDKPSDMHTLPEDPGYEEMLTRVHTDAPTSGGKYILFMMFTAFGYLMSDVCADGMVVELAQREPLAVRGTTQSAIYGTRTAFNIIGQLVVGFAFNGKEYGGDFSFSLSFPTLMLITGICIVPVLPMTWLFIKEEKHEAAMFRAYVGELWRLIQTRAVYQVIFYSFFSGILANFSYTASSPVQSILVGVTPVNATIASIISSFVFMLGITLTGKYGLHWNWRVMIVVTGAMVIAVDMITTFITLFNVFRSQWFWLGVPLIINLPAGVGFLISTFVVVELAGEGNEGAMYGLLTTVNNLSIPFAATMTKIVDASWDFSNARIKTDTKAVRTDIMWSILLVYMTNILSWGFLVFLPKQKEATQELKRTGGSSKILGGITVSYLTFALVWSVTTNLMGIFESTSCLVIAGGDGG